MMSIPTVRLTAEDAADQLDRALREFGFVQLVGHGASAAAAAALRDHGDAFFALSPEVKSRFVHPAPEANRGFRAKGAEALSYSLGQPSPPDLFESFNCGADDRVDGTPLFQSTPWPDDVVPGFATAAHGWLREMENLSARLDRILGDLLGIDLATVSTAGPDTMAIIDYRPGPDGEETPVAGQQRMGAHSDYTSFTILDADPVPGLQIIGSDGRWLDVTPEPDGLLLNIGDVVAMLTNDRWPSTLHRVVPMADGCAPTRRSVAYFHYPDRDYLIGRQPLADAIDESRYQPVTVAEHLLGKLTAPKLNQPPTSASTAGDRL